MAHVGRKGTDLPAGHVPRPRLLAQLLDATVAVIEAPAGYGKSVLASDYRRALGVACLWVPLAPPDEDVTIFASALRRALRAARLSDLSAAMATASPASWADRFLDVVTGVDEPLLVVLDDAHHLTGEGSASLVMRLARGLPPPHRLVVTARRLPARIEALVTVLGVVRLQYQQLAFSETEALELIRTIHGLRSRDDNVRLLVAATEGWASALVLAATTLARRGGLARDALRAAGGQGLIGPLLDGIVARLTPQEHHDVIQLAHLPYFSPDLVAGLTRNPLMFQHMVTAGVPVARTVLGRWEMPGPVAGHLARQARLAPGAARAAAGMYWRDGDIPTALRVLLDAGQRDRAASLLAGMAPGEAEDLGWAEIRHVTEAAGDNALRRHPRILLHLARVAEAAQRRDLRREALDQAWRIAERSEAGQLRRGAAPRPGRKPDPALVRELRAERAHDLVWDERTRGEAATLARSVIEEAGAGELAARARALDVLGRLRTFWSEDGPHDDAEPLLAESARLARLAGHPGWAARALVALAIGLHFDMCRYDRALAVLDEALILLPARSHSRCYVLTFRADVLAVLGRYTEATAVIEDMRMAARAAQEQWLFAYASWTEAVLFSSLGDRNRTVQAVLEVHQHRAAWFDEAPGIEFLAQAADLLDRVGEHAMARDHLRQARSRMVGFERVVRVHEACVLGRSGEPRHAEQVIASVLARPDLDPQERWPIMLLRAYAAMRRDDGATGALAAQAFEICRDLGIPDAPLRREPAAAEALLPLAAAAGSAAAAALLGGAAKVSLSLLGGFDMQRGGQRLRPPPGRPATAIRAVAAAGGRLHAEQLIEILWPDTDLPTGRNRLKNLLSRLRLAVGDVLVRDGDTITLTAGTESDAALFEAEAREALTTMATGDRERAAALARAAVTRYHGDLLPADRYEPWATQPRERLRLRYLELLDLAAAHAEALGDVDDAVRLVQRAIDTEPYDEDRYLRLATMLASQGRAGSARATLRQARAALRELDIGVSEELEALESSLGAAPLKSVGTANQAS